VRRSRHGNGRGGNPVARYVRARLHRRIFFLLGAAIFFTAAIFGIAQWSLGGDQWRREMQAGRTFVGGRFERVWDDPRERDELAGAMARDLSLDVKLEDKDHGPLPGESFGGECRRPVLTAPVERQGETLGYATICADRLHPRTRGMTILSILAAVFVLWAISGRLARRLTRPLGELARVAHDIGLGKLSSRFAIPRRGAYGETRVLAHAINDMADRIEKQMKDQRELLAGVSHEIRTPLSRIRLLVELCRSRELEGKLFVEEKTLDEIDREVVEIDALVSELLASSRLDFAALSPHELDAKDLASRALERVGVGADKLRIEAPVTRFTGDATLLARALANLVENAVSHGGGLDALVVRSSQGALIFEALDRGPGFLPGEEERVFESFYQRAGALPRHKGALGLGLTLVKRIAEAHGGRAFAANREGGGASVGIELPDEAAKPGAPTRD
jgi:two-component system, OmpR family, sensor kinase